MKQFLVNPFTRIAGGKALAWGLVFLAVESVIMRMVSIRSHSVAFTAATMKSIIMAMLNGIVSMLLFALVLYAVGLLISKTRAGIRLLDVLGTTAFANIAFMPLFLFMILLPFDFFRIVVETEIDQLSTFRFISCIVLGLGAIICTIWYVKLLYKAFSISCNVDGTKAVLAFIAAIIVFFTIGCVVPDMKW